MSFGADDGAGSLATITGQFERFAGKYRDLRLYRRLAHCAAGDPEVAGLLLSAAPGQQRPVLLFASVHDFILRHPGSDLARYFASVTPVEDIPPDDPWPVFRRTCLENRSDIEEVIATRQTQTNEVNRSVLLAVLLAAACADQVDVPVSLVELGTSAGLLLGVDRYRIEVGDQIVGDPTSSVECVGDLRGGVVPNLIGFPAHLVDRVGIDLDPVDLDDEDRVRWLEACLWPDQPWRIERFRAAVDLVRRDPPKLICGDLVDALPGVAEASAAGSHLVVFHTWALTYVARERRPLVARALDAFASSGRSVSWVAAEPLGCMPGIGTPRWVGDANARPDTVLGVRRWRHGRELDPATLGWAHPHGSWIGLTG